MELKTKQNTREMVMEYILTKIKNGELKSGDKLTNERELSEKLGVSRVPIREAICALSTIGILEARQGNGTYVSAYNPSVIGKMIQTYSLFNRSLIEEIFEARVILEADAARLAAMNRTEDDLQVMEAALQRHEETILLYYQKEVDVEVMMERDAEIHLGIAASSHNNFFLQIIDTIRYISSSRHIFSEKYTLNPDHFKESAVCHRKIYEAIRKQDGNAAYQMMHDHIMQVRGALDIQKLEAELKDYSL